MVFTTTTTAEMATAELLKLINATSIAATANETFVTISAAADAEEACDLHTRFALNGVIAGTTCLLGIVGNCVSFLILLDDKSTPIASFLLRLLAVADSLFLALWYIQFSLRDMLDMAGVHQSSLAVWMYVRLYTYPLLFACQTATMWMTVLIAVVRYLAVCWPYRALQMCQVPNVRRAAVTVAIGSFVYNLPRFLEVRLSTTDSDERRLYMFERTSIGSSSLYTVLYFDILYYCFNFILPLLILVLLSIKLTIAYRKLSRRRNIFRSTRRSHHDPNITLIMIVVIVTFIVCNGPARLVQMVWRYKPQTCLSLEYVLMKLSNVLEVLNSSTNFVIYCVFRRQFRQMVQMKICQYRRHAPETISLAARSRLSLETTRTIIMSEC